MWGTILGTWPVTQHTSQWLRVLNVMDVDIQLSDVNISNNGYVCLLSCGNTVSLMVVTG